MLSPRSCLDLHGVKMAVLRLAKVKVAGFPTKLATLPGLLDWFAHEIVNSDPGLQRAYRCRALHLAGPENIEREL
jgi:hypothetical protein